MVIDIPFALDHPVHFLVFNAHHTFVCLQHVNSIEKHLRYAKTNKGKCKTLLFILYTFYLKMRRAVTAGSVTFTYRDALHNGNICDGAIVINIILKFVGYQFNLATLHIFGKICEISVSKTKYTNLLIFVHRCIL